MGTTPRRGWESRHDWLFVGSTSHCSASDESVPRPNGSRQHWFSRALLRKIQDRLGKILCHARVSSSEAASLLIQEVRKHHFANRSWAALRRIDLARAGAQIRNSWRWARAQARPLRLVHALAAIFALVIILPLGYLAYCIATLPSDGGLIIETTPSKLVVEADGGQAFATRGVFKGEKLSAQDVPVNLSRAIIAIEDRHFYEHGGFYLPSLMRAAYRNFVSGSTREGEAPLLSSLLA